VNQAAQIYIRLHQIIRLHRPHGKVPVPMTSTKPTAAKSFHDLRAVKELILIGKLIMGKDIGLNKDNFGV
jgi:hypothetical protein